MEKETSSSSQASLLQHHRHRTAFSCTNCRHGKQKCDRQKPCSSCLRRGRRDTCRYEEAVFDLNSQPGIQRPLRPAPTEHTPKVAQQNLQSVPSSPRNLDGLGYSDLHGHNALAIFNKLELIETGSSPNPRKKYDSETHLRAGVLEKYIHLLRLLPSRSYVDALVVIYFDEVGWQYSVIDHNVFADQLNTFYSSSYDKIAKEQSLRPELFSFPSLLFQVLALALQFLPSNCESLLDGLCTASSFDYLAGEYSNTGLEISALLEKDRVNLVSVQAAILRVCWLKNCGRVTESWHALGHVILDAKEIGLHREDGKVEVNDAEIACSQLWSVELRRRVWLNLYLWDSEMAMVLGKPMNINLLDCSACPPMDAHISQNRKTTVPFPRAEFDKPTSFTQRLIEYHLQIYLHEIRELAAEGPYPRDYTKVQRLHRKALDYINKLPAIYRFDNPDKSFDGECPWLRPQREYLCSITWFFVLALHKPYLFSVPESRAEIIKAGINLLKAQQRNIECVKVQHYKLFILTFLTVEAAVSILAVLITHPADADMSVPEVFSRIQESVSRLRLMQENRNYLAGPAADVIQVLLSRAEAIRIARGTGVKDTPIVIDSLITYGSTTIPNSMNSQQSTSYSQSHGIQHSNSVTSSFNSPQATSLLDKPLSPTDWGMDVIGTDSGYMFPPLQPMADLMYHELAPTMYSGLDATQGSSSQSFHQAVGDISEDEHQQQFTGDFSENSFWSYMNQGF